jgi:adenine C2-methylase RlmN of 23S rRNA A2503 and tRNA A37
MVEDIRNFSVGELEARFKSQGMETYRARQVFGWLYQKKAEDFSLIGPSPKRFLRRAT